mmetsp:Transcript_32214/g.78292  ORF Transcript_32214/g.78292 Transcript_32214/m.78292 type:complete len:304 (+) Transcript_32214:389-1300(+)|eukprot:CAMPEP_0113621154 /NCGR_PEP_ID=MMETSP0017_2-20120614/10802_1 /TAXON_ID=2856 /ORGANISM="Cylindrotheca closterium" /LENGTH=303 /DNA_ID=CAMNT_0000530877 /DNA_START=365 /DNA_END=1276 /DNA_ORIENTATION=+ /assembly_acc=CAM_ASM_000147
MALSPGGLAGIILFIILLHVAVLVALYFYVLKNPSKGSRFTVDDQHHGNFRWAILGLISLSWIFSVAATSACTFMKINMPTQTAWVGLNAYENPVDGCTRFVSIDNRNNPAFTFAVFNCLLTSLGLVGMVLMQFVVTAGRQQLWLCLRIFMYISLWCCMFTFYIQETVTCDVYECSLAGAGIAQAFNVIWLVVACALMFVTPHGDDTGIKTAQKQQALEDDDLNLEQNHHTKAVDMTGAVSLPGQELETETHLPDGSVQRQVESTNPDGSKTVTTTIEHPDGGKGEAEDGDDDEEHPTHGAVV